MNVPVDSRGAGSCHLKTNYPTDDGGKVRSVAFAEELANNMKSGSLRTYDTLSIAARDDGAGEDFPAKRMLCNFLR